MGVFIPSTQRHYRRLILLLNTTYTAACLGRTPIFKQKYIISSDSDSVSRLKNINFNTFCNPLISTTVKICVQAHAPFWARDNLDGSGVVLQAGRSRIRVPMKSIFFFFNLLNTSSRTMTLGFRRPQAEMSTRRSFWGRARRARKADNLTAICEPIV
jgi:hypothetical protein